MKHKILLSLLLLSSSLTSFSGGIRGLDPHEKVDATKCLQRLHNITYDQINIVPNDLNKMYSNRNLSRILMHNFINDLIFEESKIEDSAIISGSLLVNGKKLSLRNTVIANVTLAGDVSNVDFTGACLINVSLPTKTSWIQYFKIRNAVEYSSNIEFNDDIHKHY